MKKKWFCMVLGLGLCYGLSAQTPKTKEPISVSGIYPSLAYFNNEGECGTGAVVPWANRLWVISYGPHLPYGSSDKLHEITPQLTKIIRPESIGGTPANRMIHKESNQLFIGPYAIDTARNVRVIPVTAAPGRLTGIARSPKDPANKVIIATMEEGFYEIDVKSLAVNTLYKDGNQQWKEKIAKSFESELLVGVHGKGFYSSQGVCVFSNNGEQGYKARIDPRTEAGSLSEWDGNQWKLIRRNQFTEVTGPGGIYGNPNPATDPIWSTGWDYKSVLLAVRDKGNWAFYRLPKASNSYDGAHGWNTEWPRIRDIGAPDKKDYLMTMHGMFWCFPGNFDIRHAAGIRPRSSYLKVIGDFTRWNNQLVFGCDDAAKSEFLNKRKAKGGIEGPGQSQSNLWFTSLQQPDNTGTTSASGAVWLKETIAANTPSEPFLFAGWSNRTAWIKNDGDSAITFTFSVDAKGNNEWKSLKTITVAAKQAAFLPFAATDPGEWIRASANKKTVGSLSFVYTATAKQAPCCNALFNGLATTKSASYTGGLLYSLGNNRRTLAIVANQTTDTTTTETGLYELTENMQLLPKKDTATTAFVKEKLRIPANVVTVEQGSYLIVDDAKRRWRLPLGNAAYATLMEKNALRLCREVATERDLFNCGGTLYELPAENADGYAKIRPIASHNYVINDYTSYRGMLVMSGLDASAKPDNQHIFQSADKKCTIWAGTIDDLWKMGKPTGKGGPWYNSTVVANKPSDAYLFGYYDSRKLTLSHQSKTAVSIQVQFDPMGDNDWVTYNTYEVLSGKKLELVLPSTVQARWIRFVSNTNTTATAWLDYE